ncbi:MAG: hypothetical protein MJ154_02615 [Candidatus Saccharibacteria bacterium]|nr:hypothetical protein [Candidatus Saccharibacteria bacterium]
MKKGIIFAIAASIAAIAQVATPSFASAQTASYNNYSNLPSVIDRKYASSKIYYTEDTKITAKKVSDDGRVVGETEKGVHYTVSEGDSAVFLIENSSARDYDGNLVDVIFKIDNIKYADNAVDANNETITDRIFHIQFSPAECGSEKDIPNKNDCTASEKALAPGDPIVFWLNSGFTKGDFTVQYIKKGSFNDSTLTGTPAGLEKLTYMAYDFDVPTEIYTVTYNNPDSTIQNTGDEATFVKSSDPSKTTYYYNQGYTGTVYPIMYGQDNGIGVKTLNEGGYTAAFNGIYHSTSYFAVVDDMKDSSYTFSYNATRAGISVFFGSPVAYETPAPVKHINDNKKLVESNKVNPGSKYDYVISQYVPDQFSSQQDIVMFASLWTKYNNVKTNRNYESFAINDVINENLEILTDDGIRVTRSGVDVTDEFEIAVNGQDVIVSAKSASLTNAKFYGEEILVHIPVKVKDDASEGQIVNAASTTYKNTELTNNTKDSNEVATDVTIIPEAPETPDMPENPKTDDNDLLIFFVMFGASTAGSAVLLAKTTKRR